MQPEAHTTNDDIVDGHSVGLVVPGGGFIRDVFLRLEQRKMLQAKGKAHTLGSGDSLLIDTHNFRELPSKDLLEIP